MREAQRLGLEGWVRNLRDGRVEVLVEGEEDKVDELVRWCRKGPSSAHVTGLEETREEPSRQHKDFTVKYTTSVER
jgi:acylphosphatase